MSNSINLKLLQKHSMLFPTGTADIKAADVLRKRRINLLKELDSFAVFSGIPQPPGEENLWIINNQRIFQDPSILFLTGINQPEIILLLDPFIKPKATLFVPEKDPNKEFWNGFAFGYSDKETLSTLTGIRCIKPLENFEETIQQCIKGIKKKFFYTYHHKYMGVRNGRKTEFKISTDHNYRFAARLKRLAVKTRKKTHRTSNLEVRSCAELHHKLRTPLDPYQIKDTIKAIKLTNEAFLTVASELSNKTNEYEISTCLESELLKRSKYGLSFPAIVASGKNALVLHYLKNDSPLKPGSLVLLDFGVRWGLMNSDISRTVPINGKFNPLQKLLYQIVIDAQRENQKNAREGVTINELNERVWTYIELRLKRDFFDFGGQAKRPYDFQPHGVSHLIGIQVHDGDPFRLYQSMPMETGWLISNEPGIYGHFKMEINGTLYSEAIGIRIEDNLLITKSGCENLSRRIPKNTAAIENLIKS